MKPAGIVVLLPPSEGKAEGGRGVWRLGSGAFGGLSRPRREVVEAVKDLLASNADMARLSDARGVLAERAMNSWRLIAAGKAPVLPAWQRFTGVVWEHLGPGELDDGARARIVVPTALAGLVAGTDPVPDFRLKFSVTVPGPGRLDRYWQPWLGAALADWAEGGKVFNLLPSEHSRAVGPVPGQTVVSFLDRGRAAAGHGAKAVKGVFARRLLTHGTRSLSSFSWQGWSVLRTRSGDLEVIAP